MRAWWVERIGIEEDFPYVFGKVIFNEDFGKIVDENITLELDDALDLFFAAGFNEDLSAGKPVIFFQPGECRFMQRIRKSSFGNFRAMADDEEFTGAV